MKAIFFSLNKVKHHFPKRVRRYSKFSLKVFAKKYGTVLFFATVLIFGMIFGSFYAQSADEKLYKGLDFLFTTNLNSRLSQGFFETFCACFASNFVFTAVIFLLGITPWGIPFIPLVCAFKGFGAGLSGGFLVESHSLWGFLFYLAVLLPGVFAFCLVLLSQSNLAFYNSKRIFRTLFLNDKNDDSVRHTMIFYLQRSITVLIAALGCAVLDTLLWCLLAPLFSFG